MLRIPVNASHDDNDEEGGSPTVNRNKEEGRHAI